MLESQCSELFINYFPHTVKLLLLSGARFAFIYIYLLSCSCLQTLAKANISSVFALDKKSFYGAAGLSNTFKVLTESKGPRILSQHGRTRGGARHIRVLARKAPRQHRRDIQPGREVYTH